MDSVERVRQICKSKKIPISKLEKDLGYSNGYISQLRKGVFPSDRLISIAEYLGVSTNYLMTGEDDPKVKAPELTARDERDIAKDLKNIMEKLKNGEAGPASFDGTEIPEETQELFAQQLDIMLHHLKKINKEKYNPYKNKK